MFEQDILLGGQVNQSVSSFLDAEIGFFKESSFDVIFNIKDV